MEIRYRIGRREDCYKIAEGIDLASGGIIEFLFHGLRDDKTNTEYMAELLDNDDVNDSYKSAIVAEYQGEVIGIVFSYPAEYHGIDENMKKLFPSERLAVFEDFYNSRVENSLFLDSIYVHENFRKMGIGNKLIELTKDKAKRLGYNKVSLMVMADNLTAQKVYKNANFTIAKHVKLEANEFIPHYGGVYMMACNLK